MKRLPALAVSKRWAIPMGVWVLFSIFNLAFVATSGQQSEPFTVESSPLYLHEDRGGGAQYDELLRGWDGEWYKSIGVDGYPEDLPRDGAGSVEPSAWAFYPLYPKLVGTLASGLNLPFELVGAGISSLAMLGGLIIGYGLVKKHSKSDGLATLATVSLCLTPAYLAFMGVYTEGLALFLLMAFLSLLQDRRYAWALAPLLLMGLTRGVGAPLVAFVGLYCLMNWRTIKPLAPKLYLPLAAVVSFSLWPLLVWAGTGEPMGYVDTYGAFFPFSPFLDWFSLQPTDVGGQVPRIIYPLLVIGYAAYAFFSSSMKHMLPLEWRLWAVIYCAYIFTVTANYGSEVRYLALALLALPASLLTPRLPRWALYCTFVLLVLVALALQYHWIDSRWVLHDLARMGRRLP